MNAIKETKSNTMSGGRLRKVHYVLSTHWDREWYQSFQDFRYQLVKLLDRTLGDMQDGRLKGPFTTDGQAIVLEDYLEIRQEQRSCVERLAKAGKLKMGPWYVLPDEWLVSGEALIRNLRLGREVSRQLGGEPSNAGFVCDLFGHIGQMPQLFAGFGIKGGFVWRGLEPRKMAHFVWEGSDGTRLPCFRFPRMGYCDFGCTVRRMTQPDVQFDAERIRKDLKWFLEREAGRTAVPPLLVFDGGDHLEYDSDLYNLLFKLKPGREFPYEIIHSTLDDYLDEMLIHSCQITDVVRGELRETGRRPLVEDMNYLIPGVLSSRVWIKQANCQCQSLLCNWSEPFCAIASAFTGIEYPHKFLEVAWRWLLMNHPHDSICGCSVDAVHEDMKYRFAQCRQIAERQADEALRTLTGNVIGKVGTKELRVLVANPLPHALHEPMELMLQIPDEWHCFHELQEGYGGEPKPGFRVYDPTGKELPYQRIAQTPNRTKKRLRPNKFPQAYKTNDVTICLELDLPALGYTTLTVREGDVAPSDDIVSRAILPTRYPETPGLATSERAMENEFIHVSIESDGTLTLTDKRNGQTYCRLLTFEDAADIGDGWYHGQPVNDQIFVSMGAGADVALVQNGPLQSCFRVRTLLSVPTEFNFNRMVRSEERTSLIIENFVTLRSRRDWLEIKTKVKNCVKDHRLRVIFPTGVRAKTYLADGAFDVTERRVFLPVNNHLGREQAVESRPQQSWTAISNARRGLAVVSKGLMESCVRDLVERPLALTLFRATRRTVFTDGELGGQVQGELCFDYWIVPFHGAADRVRLCELGVRLASDIRDVQMTASDVAICPKRSALPPTASFLSLAGNVVMTSVREIAGKLEVRLFNPETKATTATFDFSGRPSGAPMPRLVEHVNLESQPIGGVKTFLKRYQTRLRGKQILTLRFMT